MSDSCRRYRVPVGEAHLDRTGVLLLGYAIPSLST
jgi:hypothetical protein